jgi:hypothetical protein
MKNPVALVVLSLAFFAPRLAAAHCDSLDGPVVKAAQKALESGKAGPVLAWVQPKDEAVIKASFEKTLAVRKLGPGARELADQHFFETLVRVHRAGEGAPYTGLKPAGSVKDPALAAADKSIETGQLEPVSKLLAERVQGGLSERFARLRALKAPGDDAAKGRAWVEAYVAYIHYAAGVHQAAAGEAPEHESSGDAHGTHHEE